MARIIGEPGRTAQRIEGERLLKGNHRWAWLLPTTGVGAAAMTWGTGGMRTSAVTIAAFMLVGAGLFWMFLTGTPLKGLVPSRTVGPGSSIADLAIAAGLGGIAGSVLADVPSRTRTIHGEAVVVGAVLIGGVAWWRLRSASARIARVSAGTGAERAVAGELARLSDDFVVIHDALIRSPAGAVEVDHLVLGPTGLFVIETKRWGGRVTPGPDRWVQNGHRGSRTHPSPAAQLQRIQQAVGLMLGLPREQVSPILVLASGKLTAPVEVQVERIRTVRSAITRGVLRWPLPSTPLEAARRLVSV